MSKSKKASEEALDELHTKLANTLMVEIMKASGEKGKAAILNVARQFLKDNDIICEIGTKKALTQLAEVLPFVGAK